MCGNDSALLLNEAYFDHLIYSEQASSDHRVSLARASHRPVVAHYSRALQSKCRLVNYVAARVFFDR